MDKLNVVFIHGWGMNQGVWEDFLRVCKRNWTANINAIDLPGFGSQLNSRLSDYSLDKLAQYVGVQLESNSLLVGWSLGGLIAQQLVNDDHPKVIGHVQIASTPKFQQTSNWPGIKPAVLQQFAKQLQEDQLALIKRFLAIQCLGLPNAKKIVKSMLYSISKYPESSLETLESSLGILVNTDLREDFRKQTHLPCLRIFGVLDSLVPKRVIEMIADLDQSTEVYVIPKASHAPFISHPEECFQLIDLFIKNKIKNVPGQSDL